MPNYWTGEPTLREFDILGRAKKLYVDGDARVDVYYKILDEAAPHEFLSAAEQDEVIEVIADCWDEIAN